MATVEEALQSQIKNIVATYGKPIEAWVKIIVDSAKATGKQKHGELVAMLKKDFKLPHGAAHRLSLIARETFAPAGPAKPKASKAKDPAEALYPGDRAALRPIHDKLMVTIEAFGEHEVAPKKGYLSLRRKTQFAMIQPGLKWVNVGLVLKGFPVTERLESAEKFNPLFTHRVRVRSVAEVDTQLVRWLKQAYDHAG